MQGTVIAKYPTNTVTQNTHSVLEVGTTIASRDYTSFIIMQRFDAHPV